MAEHIATSENPGDDFTHCGEKMPALPKKYDGFDAASRLQENSFRSSERY